MSRPEPSVSSAVTEGMRVIVRSVFAPERSLPMANRYVFVCSIRIENEGAQSAQVRSQHWAVTSFTGKVAHVRTLGLAGKQPVLRPGEHFEYSCDCILQTPTGELRGSYQMQRANGRGFDAIMAPFRLAPPYSMN
jgi:ApaG protein